MPRLGLGTWPMSDREAERTVPLALGLGYRLIDTAYAYRNERGVGRGIRAAGIPREELFVTTKLNGDWHGVREAQEALAESAKLLELDYVDLYLIHWPLPRQDRYLAAWQGLIELLEDGRARAIGVSNFKPAHIDRLIAQTGFAPHVNQIQLDPTVARPGPRAYHARHGIVTESWSPLGKAGPLLDEPTIVAIAERHARTPAQVVLRWHLELGLVAIPKASTADHLRENIDLFDFRLTPEEVTAISSLDQGESAAHDSDIIGH
jgi:2,5-diketo-D-gluconate reductase A